MVSLRDRLDHGLALDLLALLVEAVEFGCDAAGLDLVGGEQEPRAEACIADAAAGIDARAEQEAEMPGLDRPVEPGDVHQRRQPRPGAPAQDGEALADEGAVEPLQRHHVRDRRQRDQVERCEQIGLAAAGRPDILAAQHGTGGDQRQEDDAGRAEMAQPREIVLPVGIDQRLDLREPLRRLMMVEHDDIEAEPPGLGQRLVAGGPAIDRDQQRRALGGELADGVAVGSVAFDQAVGDVDARMGAARRQEARQQRRRTGAVDIVIAEDRDAFTGRDRAREAFGRGAHVDQRARIGQQVAQLRLEKGCRLVGLDPAPGQEPCQDVGKALALS